jgi:demethylmenaquinone methyltransferase/2-methoxy-6-polyprenyl-1,4-benzoquinol methylase
VTDRVVPSRPAYSAPVTSAGDPDHSTAAQLRVMEALTAPVDRAAVAALGLPAGSRGLDAGCGLGLQSVMLAEEVGPRGQVVGVDLSPHLLAEARRCAAAAGVAGRVRFEVADVRCLPYPDGEFDWAWSANCVGYGLRPAAPAVAELVRVVRPGGWVALLVWSSQTLLPGHPRLEALLNATVPGMAPFGKHLAPGEHHLRGLGLLRSAGLEGIRARTLLGEAHAPLAAPERAALAALIAMRWPGAEAELPPADAAEFRRLCLPEAPGFIVDHPDYYAFFTETLFWGRVGMTRG